MARRPLFVALTLLTLVLLGTLIFLTAVTSYYAIPSSALLQPYPLDMPAFPADPMKQPFPPYNNSGEYDGYAHLVDPRDDLGERIPRILHWTWKDDVLPERWKAVRDACMQMHSDYEHILWTDSLAQQFISTYYPWFLPTYTSYPYPIQRADAIRYFVLHHYGGVYLDLDVGCRRRVDPLLQYPVILAKTIPVGVSNDVMFSERHGQFMVEVIHNLQTFNHRYISNYPTVMFSTGPMFISTIYGLWLGSHPAPPLDQGPDPEAVRVLPKSLYGKNAKPGTAPEAFFDHYYGSSWHADDAGFITFLGRWGRGLLVIGGFVLAIGVIRLLFAKRVVSPPASIYPPGAAAYFFPSSPPPHPSTNDDDGSVHHPAPARGIPLLPFPVGSAPLSRPGSPSRSHSRQPSAGLLPAILYYPFSPSTTTPAPPRSAASSLPWPFSLAVGRSAEPSAGYSPLPTSLPPGDIESAPNSRAPSPQPPPGQAGLGAFRSPSPNVDLAHSHHRSSQAAGFGRNGASATTVSSSSSALLQPPSAAGQPRPAPPSRSNTPAPSASSPAPPSTPGLGPAPPPYGLAAVPGQGEAGMKTGDSVDALMASMEPELRSAQAEPMGRSVSAGSAVERRRVEREQRERGRERDDDWEGEWR